MFVIVTGDLNANRIHWPASVFDPSCQDVSNLPSIAFEADHRSPSCEEADAADGLTCPVTGTLGWPEGATVPADGGAPGVGLAPPTNGSPPRRSAAPMKPRTRAPTRIGMRMRSQRHERFCGSSSTCCGVVSIANSGLPHDLQKRRVDSFSVPHAEQMTPLGATSRASSSGGLTISISER